MKTCAENQRSYRLRKAARLERLERGHRRILEELGEESGPVASMVRAYAEEALG